MNWYVIFFDGDGIYRKALYREGTPIEKFIQAICDGEIGAEHCDFIAEDDYEAFLDYSDMEEVANIEFYDLT